MANKAISSIKATKVKENYINKIIAKQILGKIIIIIKNKIANQQIVGNWFGQLKEKLQQSNVFHLEKSTKNQQNINNKVNNIK